MFRRLLVVVVSVLGLLLGAPLPAVGQDIPTLLLTGVDAEAFPAVQIFFRAFSADQRVLTDLSAEQITIYEDGQPVGGVELSRRDDVPLHIVFVIDLGRYSNFSTLGVEQTRQTLNYLVDGGYFRDGVDTVEVLGRVFDGSDDRTVILLEPTQSAAVFTSYVGSAGFQRTGGPTRGLLGVQTALERLAERLPPGQEGAAIFFVTALIDRPINSEAVPQAREIGRSARGRYIPIYTFHTHASGELPDPLQALAAESGGEYLRLVSGADQRLELDRMYGSLAAQRTAFTATYRSSSGSSNPRTVALSPLGLPPEAAAGTATYAVDLQPPRALITVPADGAELAVEVIEERGEEPRISPDSIAVEAQIDAWPDGYPRDVVAVELIVDGEAVAQIAPPPGERRFNLGWPLSPPEADAPPTHTLEVRITDELGLQTTAGPITVALGIGEAAQPPAEASCWQNPLRLGCIALFVGIPLALFALLAVGAAVFVISRRRRKKAVRPLAAGADHTLVVPGGAGMADEVGTAWLEVLDGPPGQKGRTIPLEEEPVRIGRASAQADITFYEGEQTSVSGLHCTIQQFRGQFFVTDNGSTNGTTVNGQPLRPAQPFSLNNGDEIILGHLQMRGVRLRFNLPGGAANPYVTQIDGDPFGEHTMIDSDGLS